VRSGLRVPAVVAQRSAPPAALPPGNSPLQLLWLGRVAQRAERGLPDRSGRGLFWITGRGIEVREGDQRRGLLPGGHLPAGEAATTQRELLRQDPRERANRQPAWWSKARFCFQSEGAAVLQRLLDVLAEPGSDGGGACWAASPLRAGAPKDDRPGTGQRLGVAGGKRLVRLSAIAHQPRACWRPLGTLISPAVNGRNRAQRQAPRRPAAKAGAEAGPRTHAPGKRLSARRSADCLRRRPAPSTRSQPQTTNPKPPQSSRRGHT